MHKKSIWHMISNDLPYFLTHGTVSSKINLLIYLLLLLLFVFFFLRGGKDCLPQHRRDVFSLITITPVGMGKP